MMSDAFEVKSEIKTKSPLNLGKSIEGVKRFSPRVKWSVLGVILALGLLLMFAVDSMDEPASVAIKEEEQAEELAPARMPQAFLEAGDGVSVPQQPPPVVPAVGDGQVKEVKAELPPLTKEEQLALAREERRRLARERAMESQGSVSGFTVQPTSSASGNMSASVDPAAMIDKMADRYREMNATDDGEDDQNRQKRKDAFMKEAQNSMQSGYLESWKTPSLSRWQVRAGAVIPGIIQKHINSDLPGQITGLVSEDVMDSATGRHVLIPKGTLIVGTYDSHIAYGQERLLAVWQWLEFPDQSKLFLKGMPAGSGDGTAGFGGEVNNHYLRIFGSALAMSVITAGAQLSQQRSDSDDNDGYPTMGEVMSAALGQQLGQAGASLMQKNLNIQPTIEVPVGTRFVINVTKTLVFEKPYIDK